MSKYTFSFIVFLSIVMNATAQPGRWQQQVKYKMDIDMDVSSNRFTGKQQLEYSNQSPDKLDKLFYHLYWNAFQPNSSMDQRSRELGKVLVNNRPDWDGRVRDRISKLKEDEIGYQKIKSLKMNGVPQPFVVQGTILIVTLTKPILPKTKVMLEMEFEAQVPLQVRRSGRDNPGTGVRYSMSQWYPKLCEYDYEGWHPNPYIAREFYGVWGDFDVNIKIQKDYRLGGTGVLVNAAEIGWGYDRQGTDLKQTVSDKRIWKFSGKNIHDFVWAADTAYKHLTYKVKTGTTIHVIYKNKNDKPETDLAWQKVGESAVSVLPFIEKNFGAYPYPQYSFIHGGDGGMEYPMATLLSGPSLGTVFHEWMHSWYQMMLGTNESLYAWMDEGFTSYAEDLIVKHHEKRSSLQEYRDTLKNHPENKNLQELVEFVLPEDHAGSYMSYYRLVKSGLEEPLTTHADHFNSNFAYSVASYSKGEVFLEQLGYIVGAEIRDSILLDYYRTWRFKHPNVNDFFVIAQKRSGLMLNWYKQYWVNGTKTINYAIDSLWEDNGKSNIRLKRIGQMPMPIDLQLVFKDGAKEMHHIPLDLMFGGKKQENNGIAYTIAESWQWTSPTYILVLNHKLSELRSVEIDPSKRMADVERKNNLLELNW